MTIIKEAYKEIQEHLDNQSYNTSDSFHSSAFVIKETTEIGVLFYNTFTGEILLLDSCEDEKYLRDRWYYVADKYNEFEVLESFREKLISLEEIATISTYTIFPTTDCNANCFYCFEEGRSKKNMDDKTSVSVADYIIKNSKNENISIRWFGGEPLYNQKAINSICNILNENKINFTSKMATNGFLFSEFNIDIACFVWHLKHVQITLDGTEAEYNKIKNYKCSNTVNPFKKVLKNIDLLTSKGIQVIIRLNLDLNNVADQINLVNNVLVKRFANNNNVSIYSHLLMESLLYGTDLEHKQLFELKEVLDSMIYKNGLSCHKHTSTKFKLFRCIADNKKSVTILPEGNIGLCEHYSEDHFISNLNNQQYLDSNEISFLRERMSPLDICADCSFYPQCIRLKCCPDSGVCFSELKKHNIRNLHKELIAEYNSFCEQNDIKINRCNNIKSIITDSSASKL